MCVKRQSDYSYHYGACRSRPPLCKQVYVALVLLTNRLLPSTVCCLPGRCRQTFLCSSPQPLILVLLAGVSWRRQCKFLERLIPVVLCQFSPLPRNDSCCCQGKDIVRVKTRRVYRCSELNSGVGASLLTLDAFCCAKKNSLANGFTDKTR